MVRDIFGLWMGGDWVVVVGGDGELSAKERREDSAFWDGDVMCRIEICERVGRNIIMQ